jgi:dTDP-4-dehydrorhamnose 3,5-epimerase-like enzyme
MKSDRLESMVKGWFVGAFNPVAFHTDACEVAVKRYCKGDHEGAHMHKIATEVTVIVEGSVRMCGREWEAGDIITIPPGEATDFLALTDVLTVVVKCPGVLDDKYVLDDQT